MRLIKVVFEKIWLVLAIMVALFAIITGEVKRMRLEEDRGEERRKGEKWKDRIKDGNDIRGGEKADD